MSKFRRYQQSQKGKAKSYARNRNPSEILKFRAAIRAPRGRYGQQKHAAKKRGIPFLLTFEQWWGLWEPFWHMRGRGPLQMCMARDGDTGAYALGNVSIITNAQNRALQR